MLLDNKRVFLVEDNLANLSVALVFLQMAGAQTYCERWGKNFLKLMLDAAPLDVILLDLMFPANVTGYDIFEQLRTVPALKHVPVIAMSASDPDLAIPRAAQIGFSGFISKPFSPRLPAHVADVIAGKSVWIGDSVF